MSPWFITSSLFTLLAAMLWFNMDKWGVTFLPATALLVTMSVFALGVGNMMAKLMTSLNDHTDRPLSLQFITIPKRYLILFFLIGAGSVK